ncbi:MAG: hypothetical protein ACI9GZ_003085, partial [Bacteroidia bacterium]
GKRKVKPLKIHLMKWHMECIKQKRQKPGLKQ